MSRKIRDFSQHEASVRTALTEDTWCDNCGKADLGLNDPMEYEEDGTIFVEGTCRKCGSVIRTELIERHLPDGSDE